MLRRILTQMLAKAIPVKPLPVACDSIDPAAIESAAINPAGVTDNHALRQVHELHQCVANASAMMSSYIYSCT